MIRDPNATDPKWYLLVGKYNGIYYSLTRTLSYIIHVHISNLWPRQEISEEIFKESVYVYHLAF